mgnify:CR=1 FL=1
MPTKRNRRVGVQSRKVKKPKNFSRKLSVSGKAKRRRSSTHGSSTHGSGTRRRVQRGGDPITPTGLAVILGLIATPLTLWWMAKGGPRRFIKYLTTKKERGEVQYHTTTDA